MTLVRIGELNETLAKQQNSHCFFDHSKMSKRKRIGNWRELPVSEVARSISGLSLEKLNT